MKLVADLMTYEKRREMNRIALAIYSEESFSIGIDTGFSLTSEPGICREVIALVGVPENTLQGIMERHNLSPLEIEPICFHQKGILCNALLTLKDSSKPSPQTDLTSV